MNLHDGITSLPGTSYVTLKRLATLGVSTYWDFINYFPFRYENYSLVSPIANVQEGEIVTVRGKIVSFKNEFTKRGFKIQKCKIDDGTGTIEAAWFNQQYLSSVLKPGWYLSVSGEARRFMHNVSIQPADYDLMSTPDQQTIHTGRLVPVYPQVYGLSTRTVREKIFYVLSALKLNPEEYKKTEWLPDDLRSSFRILDEWDAYTQVHFPDSIEQAREARRRLAFDELFTIQLSAALMRRDWTSEKVGHLIKLDKKHRTELDSFINNLPFELTGAQKRVNDEIIRDMVLPKPMNRFVQGDVGSGKTVLAAIACYLCHLNGYQSLIMAPTEILAQQHYKTLSELLLRYNVNVALQTGSKKMLKDGNRYDVIVGTQALVTKNLEFDNIGLVVIDEQHRFGVVQRALLKQKGINPHLLTMTATPIPRTVALTLYGELDLSQIDEMPKGRLPIKTFLVPPEKRLSAYDWIKKQITEFKTQVFVICPLIEESEVETMKSVKAAAKEFEYLKQDVFKKFSLGLLHGRMKPKEKEEVMKKFKEKEYDILVSTSVVEVGIDIPNATIMLIEGADRYGIAQLHQLRGRVGRGDRQSYCLLFTSGKDVETGRLNFFSRTNSGIRLAEYDLKVRGAGEIYGTKQSGYVNLKVASLSDFNLIRQTKTATEIFMKDYKLEDWPEVKRRIDDYREKQIARD